MALRFRGLGLIQIVVFGDEDISLLGSTTLEELSFETDSVDKTLKPTELLLM